MYKSFKLFCENKIQEEGPPRRINIRDDEDMFQQKHGAHYINGAIVTEEQYKSCKARLAAAWKGKLLGHYEEYVGPSMQSAMHSSNRDLKYFVNGMEVSFKDWDTLRKMVQEAVGYVSFGKMMNFDYYQVLNDGCLLYVPTR
jgi:hypothetical protein